LIIGQKYKTNKNAIRKENRRKKIDAPYAHLQIQALGALAFDRKNKLQEALL